MFLSAFASLPDPVSRAYYDKKRAEGKKHNAALICLARRRSDVIYAMLRDKQSYQPDRKPVAHAAGLRRPRGHAARTAGYGGASCTSTTHTRIKGRLHRPHMNGRHALCSARV
jgi:hypothetical protein